MNQVKIGKFISEMRKEQALTQSELAEMLNISNKTISKWECGNGMPELSLLIPLCQILKINLNELFSGEKLTNSNYLEKAEENIYALIKESEKVQSIIGDKTYTSSTICDTEIEATLNINSNFWNTTGNDFLEEITLPKWSSYLPTEKELHLLENLAHKHVLEIGCGKGKSLKYAHEAGASELWGLDISQNQLNFARELLNSNKIKANLICSPMENELDIPTNHFDIVYSIYGIGWPTDLNKTFKNIYSYLRKDGIFVFSWSHPIHKCVSLDENKLIFSNSYFNEDWYSTNENSEIILSNRMLSTYVNALADTGFTLVKLIEKPDLDLVQYKSTSFSRKSMLVPTSFVIKAKKL